MCACERIAFTRLKCSSSLVRRATTGEEHFSLASGNLSQLDWWCAEDGYQELEC